MSYLCGYCIEFSVSSEKFYTIIHDWRFRHWKKRGNAWFHCLNFQIGQRTRKYRICGERCHFNSDFQNFQSLFSYGRKKIIRSVLWRTISIIISCDLSGNRFYDSVNVSLWRLLIPFPSIQLRYCGWRFISLFSNRT